MMQYAIFARPVVTIYDLPQTTKQSEAGLVSTIGDEGLYGQACQVRTAPGGVTAEGVPLSPEVAEVVTFYGYHGFVTGKLEELTDQLYEGLTGISFDGMYSSFIDNLMNMKYLSLIHI